MTPHIVAVLPPRIFHVSDQNRLTLFIYSIPTYARDLFLAPRGEKREGRDPYRMDLLFTSIAHGAKVLKEGIQFGQRGAVDARSAAGHAAHIA